jgi:hypothetical protein
MGRWRDSGEPFDLRGSLGAKQGDDLFDHTGVGVVI